VADREALGAARRAARSCFKGVGPLAHEGVVRHLDRGVVGVDRAWLAGHGANLRRIPSRAKS